VGWVGLGQEKRSLAIESLSGNLKKDLGGKNNFVDYLLKMI
jgi:hypothetical protein